MPLSKAEQRAIHDASKAAILATLANAPKGIESVASTIGRHKRICHGLIGELLAEGKVGRTTSVLRGGWLYHLTIEYLEHLREQATQEKAEKERYFL
jgi:uncharacterized protein YjhX (UPF0386 family)